MRRGLFLESCCVVDPAIPWTKYITLTMPSEEKTRTSVILLYMSSELSQVEGLDFISSVLFKATPNLGNTLHIFQGMEGVQL